MAQITDSWLKSLEDEIMALRAENAQLREALEAAERDLDRRDNDEGYSPENCRWITHRENCGNRRPAIRTRSCAEDAKEVLQ